MEFSSLLIVIFIFVLSGVFIMRPFLVEEKTTRKSGSTRTDSLTAEKERLLLAIEDLDLEFELEKISSVEHNRNRDILLSEASPPPKADGDLERMINERRQQLKSEKSLKCPKCGEAIDRGAQFCSHCGEAL